jgi:hypothetical protein
MTHRIELGTWERDALASQIKTDDTEDAIRLGLEIVQAVAMPAALVLTGYAVYQGMTAFSSLTDPLKDKAEELASSRAGQAAANAAAAAGGDAGAAFFGGPGSGVGGPARAAYGAGMLWRWLFA